MQLWTQTHAKTLLPALAAMLVIAFVLRLFLGNKDMKYRMIPFQILACLLVIIEIGKQVVSFQQGYDLYHLPFHFCSLFIFALPVMAFYNGKHTDIVRSITGAICCAMTLLLLIYPCLIYSDGNIREFFTNYLSFHTVAFHNIVMFEFILIAALGLYEPQKQPHTKAVIIFTVIFCVISATMAQLLKTNFANYYSCNIAPLEAVRLAVQNAAGYVPAQILYVTIVSLLNIGFVYMSHCLYRLLNKRFAPKSAVKSA